MDEQILAVQRMQDYIAEHLNEEITLADLGREAGYSPWHAARLFSTYLDLTPAEYIRRLRLSRSAMELKQQGGSVTDKAYDLGFGSVDGYIRAFRRAFGCTPAAYARSPVPITLFIPYGIKFRQKRGAIVHMDQVQSVFIQVINKPRRKVILKRGIKAEHYFDYCEEVGCDVWGILSSMDAIGGEPVCLWLPDALITSGTSRYVQGVEVPADADPVIPEGFECITLPAASYLVFQGEPFPEEQYEEAIQAVWHAMEKYDPTLIGYEWDDTQPRIQLEPRSERGYIEMKAVRQKTRQQK